MKFPLVLAVLLSSGFATVPPQKVALIQKAMETMRLKSKMDGFINKVVNVKVQRIRNDNPGMSDTTVTEVRNTIAGVYQENLEGKDDALYPQLYAVVDKYLTDDDLKFVLNYKQSDGGQRYAKLAPRIIAEAGEVERKWDERLTPEIGRRLKDRFPELK